MAGSEGSKEAIGFISGGPRDIFCSRLQDAKAAGYGR
jgi:hypothetical protein